jgi:hypothetical protein
MTKAQLLTLLRQAAFAVNPNGLFVYARKSDQSLEFNDNGLWQGKAQILVDPATGTTDAYDSSKQPIDSFDLTVGFLVQDTPDSTNEEREVIHVQTMELMADRFFDALDESDFVEIGAISKTELTRVLAGQLSGVACSCTVKTPKACTIPADYEQPTEGLFEGLFE